jgi:outer membrane receptor protein involved in Fe transport
MVAKVEVVPNPSAKNDPEGLAGIINIVLKQNADLGTSGGYTLGAGSTGLVNASGNLGHQQGPWTLFGSYGFMSDRRTVDGYSNRENRYAAPLTYLDADIDGVMYPRSHNVTQTTEFKPGDRHMLSSNLTVNLRTFDRENDSFYSDFDASRAITGRFNRLTDQDARDLNVDWALSHRRTVDPQKNVLATEVRYNRQQSRNGVFFTNEQLSLGGTPSADAALETNDTDEHTDNLFVQADYTRGLRGGLKLETGYKGTFRQMDSDFDVALSTGGASGFTPDAARSNSFRYDEQIHAVYGVASQKVGRFDLQAGLRYEEADTRFDLATTSERYDNDYRSLFPSALANFNMDAKRQLKLSYSKRISRPDVRQLNPFGFREDALNLFNGNPRLQPEYTHAFELGYQQSLGKGSLQLTPFYRHTVDAVRFMGRVGDDGISRITFQNVATIDSYGADVNLSVRHGRLSLFGGGSAFQQDVNASNLETDLSNSAFGWSARANATYKLTNALDAQAFVMYRAPMRIEQGTMSRWTMANVALKQKVRGDKASVTLRVADPFGTMGWGVKASDGRVLQVTQRNFGARGAFLTFNYTFGKQPKMRARPQEQEGGQGGAPGMGPG